jgi:hypothetical protein
MALKHNHRYGISSFMSMQYTLLCMCSSSRRAETAASMSILGQARHPLTARQHPCRVLMYLSNYSFAQAASSANLDHSNSLRCGFQSNHRSRADTGDVDGSPLLWRCQAMAQRKKSQYTPPPPILRRIMLSMLDSRVYHASMERPVRRRSRGVRARGVRGVGGGRRGMGNL